MTVVKGGEAVLVPVQAPTKLRQHPILGRLQLPPSDRGLEAAAAPRAERDAGGGGGGGRGASVAAAPSAPAVTSPAGVPLLRGGGVPSVVVAPS